MTITRGTLGIAACAVLAALTAGAAPTTSAAQEVTLRLRQFLPAQAGVPKHILDV